MVTVGFAPVAQAGTALGGTGRSAAAEASPLGLFAALLDIFAAGSTQAPEGTTEASALQFAVPEAQAQVETTLSSPSALMVEVDSPPPTGAIDTQAGLDVPTTEPSAEELLGRFVEALAALQDAVANGTPIEPALETRLIEDLDALALALGLPLPETPTVDPAIARAATIDPSAEEALDPLALIEPSGEIPPAADSAATPLPLPRAPAPASTVAPAAPLGAILPMSGNAPAPAALAATDAPAPIADEPVISAQPAQEAELPPQLAELAQRLVKLAEAIEPRVPGLAKRLHAMAERLNTGEIDPALLAQFEIDAEADVPQGEIVRAVARLLAPGTDLKPLPAPALFAAAALVVPASIGSPNADDPEANTLPEQAPTVAVEADVELEAAEPREPTLRAAGTQPRAEPKPSASGPALSASIAAADADVSQAPVTSAASPQATATPVAVETKAALAAYKPPPASINVPQVAFEIVRQVRAGNSRFEIRLDPPELGRIDVKLDVDSAGNVNARMTVDRAETLDLMQRDRQVLERALAQAGLDGSKTNLEFSLRQNPFGREGFDFGGNGNGPNAHPVFGTGAETEPTAAETSTDVYRALASTGGVNLFV